MVGGKITDLRSLLANDLASVLEVTVDDLAVLEVDQRNEVDGGGSDQSKAPLWNDLDEEVADEGRGESLEIQGQQEKLVT